MRDETRERSKAVIQLQWRGRRLSEKGPPLLSDQLLLNNIFPVLSSSRLPAMQQEGRNMQHYTLRPPHHVHYSQPPIVVHISMFPWQTRPPHRDVLFSESDVCGRFHWGREFGCLPSPPYHWSCMFDQLLMWHNAAYSVHYAQRQVSASLWNTKAYSRSAYIKMYTNITLLLTWRLQSWHKGRWEGSHKCWLEIP